MELKDLAETSEAVLTEETKNYPLAYLPVIFVGEDVGRPPEAPIENPKSAMIRTFQSHPEWFPEWVSMFAIDFSFPNDEVFKVIPGDVLARIRGLTAEWVTNHIAAAEQGATLELLIAAEFAAPSFADPRA